jgi:hypothetical protein
VLARDAQKEQTLMSVVISPQMGDGFGDQYFEVSAPHQLFWRRNRLSDVF